MKKTTIAALVIIIASFAIGIYVYPQMPETMASHWGAGGKPDGYMSRFWGTFLMPIISLGLLGILLLVPLIDPLKNNIKKFRKYYDYFIALFIVFLFYVYLLTILWNSGYRFNMTRVLIPAMGILFYYVGILTENAKRNWFIGIRTPWTLSSVKVWEKTHWIGGKMFKAAAVIAFFGLIFQEYAILLVLVPVLFVAVYVIVYSYFEYQKELRKKKR